MPNIIIFRTKATKKPKIISPDMRLGLSNNLEADIGRSTADMLLDRLLSPSDGAVRSPGEGLCVVRMRVCRTCHGSGEFWTGGELATCTIMRKNKESTLPT